MFIEILFKILLFKGGVLIYAEHCIYIYIYIYVNKHYSPTLLNKNNNRKYLSNNHISQFLFLLYFLHMMAHNGELTQISGILSLKKHLCSIMAFCINVRSTPSTLLKA